MAALVYLKTGLGSGHQALTRETVAAIQAAEAERQPSFLLVPEDAAHAVSFATAAKSLSESLPQVWQDLFAASRSAQSTEYLDDLACQPPLPPPPRRQPPPRAAASETSSSSGDGGCCPPAEVGADSGESLDSSRGASDSSSRGNPREDQSLGITKDTAFTQYLSPAALTRRHRLGKPEVRRMYQALQVYSLRFHQAMLELTRHASDKGLLLLALWRSFAMLWDGALQVVFPTETVQASRERQAALLAGEQLQQRLRHEQARSSAMAQDNAALKQQMEGMVVQMLSVQADAAVAAQGTAGLEQQLRAAITERTVLVGKVDAGRRELLELQTKLAALESPQEGLFMRAQQLERLLKEKQGQLSAVVNQAAKALAGKEEAQQVSRGERLWREAAEQRAQQLQEALDCATCKLQEAAAEAAAQKDREQQMAAKRAEETAQWATARADWEARAAAAQAEAERLRQQLEAAQQQMEAEKTRNGELVASLWPLAARVKMLEAKLSSCGSADGSRGN